MQLAQSIQGNIPLTAREALAVARIVRVDHAGEYGAIRIYGAQIRVARWLYPDIVPDLTHMLEHELKHCAIFSAAMLTRNSRPCRLVSLWSMGGSVLGFLTALLGRQGIWTCTAAVEATVHRHLDDQLRFLAGREPRAVRSDQERSCGGTLASEPRRGAVAASQSLSPSPARDHFIPDRPDDLAVDLGRFGAPGA